MIFFITIISTKFFHFFTISIHLMILFITKKNVELLYKANFNSSYDTLYQLWRTLFPLVQRISIHLMILFIGAQQSTPICNMAISIHLMILFIPPFYHIPYFSTTPQSSLLTSFALFLPTTLPTYISSVQKTCVTFIYSSFPRLLITFRLVKFHPLFH